MKLHKTKGILLVLVWTSLPFAIYNSSIISTYFNALPLIAIGVLSLPLAGCLSDACLSRYLVIRYSMWIMWLSLIVGNILLDIDQYSQELQILTYLGYIFAGFGVLGVSGVIGNTIQFGIDQLTDASSSDITSYISWYTWTISVATILSKFTQSCLCGIYNAATSFFSLPLLCTLLVVSDMCLNHWLVKEPVAKNPFKLIYQVLKYAIKNKYPRLRSAFTYWEDKPYSRIDLGKAKYGGPFTTEQVEDVKTFFRLLAFIAATSPLAGIVYTITTTESIYYIDNNYVTSCNKASVAQYMASCYERAFVQQSPYVIIALTVPITEFIFYPLSLKCHHFSKIRIIQKVLLGIVLILLCEICFLSLEVIRIVKSQNPNVTCFLHEQHINFVNDQVFHFNYKWLLIPQALWGFAVYLLFSNTITFVCAQSPYSMKGLLLSVLYVTHTSSVGFSIGLVKLLPALTGIDDKCGIWYYSALVCSTIAVFFFQVLVIKCYTLRKREETLSNDQIFAVNYFDKYLSLK